MTEKTGVASELRQDLVSGDWVVIATGRARRPREFAAAPRGDTSVLPLSSCPFEALHEEMRAVYSREGAAPGDWLVQVVANKYPAFTQGACPVFRQHGAYQAIDGIGWHEVVVTRDHARPLGRMTAAEADLVLQAYQDRFAAISRDPCIRYISVFHNHGPRAGATIAHPHSQIIALPVIPPDIGRSIAGSRAYFERHQACVHCAVLAYEREAKERIVYENEHAVVFTPFASRAAFELRVMPIMHEAHFEAALPARRRGIAEALTAALARLDKGLGAPDYNFFLHTAPVGIAEDALHYHWHLEIIPKTAVWAGFEIGTGIEISTIAPEEAAAFLRDIAL